MNANELGKRELIARRPENFAEPRLVQDNEEALVCRRPDHAQHEAADDCPPDRAAR